MSDFAISVKLHGIFRKYRPKGAAGAPHHPFPLSVPAGANVNQVLVQLNIPAGFVNAAAVNGESVPIETDLKPDDQVSLFPPVAGG